MHALAPADLAFLDLSEDGGRTCDYREVRKLLMRLIYLPAFDFA